MADNITNVDIPKNQWVDLYAVTGIAVGTAIDVENIGELDVFLAVSATEPAPDHSAYNVIRRDSEVLRNNAGDPGAWAYCRDGGRVAVSTPLQEGFKPIINTRVSDGVGNPIMSLKGALAVYDPDVHDLIVNRFIHQHTTPVTTLAVATTGIGTEYQITVVSAAGFNVSDYIHVGNGVTETTHPRITAIAGNVLTLDRRLDIAHAIGTEVTKVYLDMSIIAGTMAAPQEYYARPQAGQIWHITRLLFTMVHGTAGDYGLFGNLTALTNGVLIRVKKDGAYRTFSNWKTNGDAKVDMFDVEFDARSGGQGQYGTSGKLDFKETGAAITLDGDFGDSFEVYVQDDITQLLYFGMKIQGHVENA